MTDLIGRTLGPYRITEKIGVGGMASVYKAYHPNLDRYVALKVLAPFHAEQPGFTERFQREARAVANLNHPNILPIFDFGQEGDHSFIAMRFVEGAGTLKQAMDMPISLKQIADVIGQIAAALDYAHQRGVIHRDVKPSNVLMDGDWALLTDFGVAKMTEASVKLTGTGVGIGTPAYMSPEQGQGLPVDHRTDVYSLGVILFEMLTGQIPHDAETPFGIVIKRINEPLPLPRSINPEIPESVERVILKALARDPEDRFATAGEMAETLEKALIEAPVLVMLPEIETKLIKERPSTGADESGVVSAPGVPVDTTPVTKTRLPGWVWGGIGALLSLVVIGGLILAARGKEASPALEETLAPVAGREDLSPTPLPVAASPAIVATESSIATPILQPTQTLAPTAVPTQAPTLTPTTPAPTPTTPAPTPTTPVPTPTTPVPTPTTPESALSPSLRGTIRYQGRPLTDSYSTSPSLWMRDEQSGQGFPFEHTYNQTTGEYTVFNVPAGKYGIQVSLDTDGNGWPLPNDLYAWTTLNVADDQETTQHDIDVLEIIHLTSPADNASVFPGPLDVTYPVFRQDDMLIAWEPLPNASTYEIIIGEWQHTPSFVMVDTRLDTRITDTSFVPSLAPLPDNHHYQLRLYAYDNSNRVGILMINYEAGIGWDFRFRVED